MSKTDKKKPVKEEQKVSPTTKYGILIAGCVVLAFIFVLGIQVPVFGLIPLLPALPCLFIIGKLSSTDADIEFGFAWIIFKTPLAWKVFFTYYFFFITMVVISFDEFYLRLFTNPVFLIVIVFFAGLMGLYFYDLIFGV